MNTKHILINSILFSFTAAFFCLLCGCSFPMDADQTSVVINLEQGSTRAAGWKDAVDIDGLELTYKIYLKGVSNPAINELIPVTSGTAQKRGVDPGNYKVEVYAYVNGWDYAYCLTDQFTVTAGQTKNVQVSMQRITNAVVLSIKKGEGLDFGYTFNRPSSPSPDPRYVKIYNFTGSPSLSVTPGDPSLGFSWALIDDVIPQDSYKEIVITPVIETSGVFDTALTLSWDGGSLSLGLKFSVYDVYDKYKITDQAGLAAIAEDLTGNYTLMNDITLTTAWTPIGSSSTNAFTGTLDGNGHKITGLTINNPSSDYQGLFGYIGASGTVKNVGIVGGSVSGKAYVGGLAGYSRGTIQSCYTTCDVTGSGVDVGGLVGNNYAGTIKNCYTTGNIIATSSANSYTGGLVGINVGTIQNCYTTSNVTGYKYVGGLLGMNNTGKIENSIALNPSITRASGSTDTNFGRVGGATGGTYSKNFARSDMIFNGITPTVTSSDSGIHGADIVFNSSLMVTGVFQFNGTDWADPSIWTIPSGVLYVGGNLPTLACFAAGSQNPTLP